MTGMTTRLGILGCGDFLRWQSSAIANSPSITVTACFDPDQQRAQKWATHFDAQALSEASALFDNPDIDVVALFVPPWIRPGLFEQAYAAGKHVIMTKPLASSLDDCARMQDLAQRSGIKSAVIYSRTDDAWVESCKDLLESGDKGKLALYRQDWIHAWPQWNNWATDPEKNGGPFMDAMIHNLNAANYLMDRPLDRAAMFSDRLSHPDMTCADTEAVIANYQGGGLAHLFITWAADLEVVNTDGNNREHIDHFYLVTDQGWHLTQAEHEGKACIRASRNGAVEYLPVQQLEQTHYEGFARHVAQDTALPRCLASIEEAAADIILLRTLEQTHGQQLSCSELTAGAAS